MPMWTPISVIVRRPPTGQREFSLPGAPNRPAPRKGQAKGTVASRHRSARGAHVVFAVLHGTHTLEIETPKTFWEATSKNNRRRERWLEACKREVEGCIAQG